jgi:hypothetical protein
MTNERIRINYRLRPMANLIHESIDRGSDYTDEEREFLLAMDRYKRAYRRPYPTWREVLHVLKCLGWRKVAEPRDGMTG